MTKHENSSLGDGQQIFRQHCKWPLITVVAFAIHCFAALLMYLLVRTEGGVFHPKEAVRVDLVEAEPEPEVPKPIVQEPASEPKKPEKLTRKVVKSQSRDPDVPADPEEIEDTDVPEIEVESNPVRAEDLPKLDLPSSKRIFAKIASEDARIRRMLDKPDDGMFAAKKGPSKFNLPIELKHDEIRRLIENHWNPDWSQIHDDGIAKVSGKWVGDGMKNWFLSYQEQVKEMGAPDRITPENVESIIAVQDNTYTSNKVSVEIDLEPLHDGTYASSVSKYSGHPFFDRAALAKVKEMSAHFPPWNEGYGYVMRYRLDATFTIVPPRASTLLALSCAFPFCTPDELKELEVIHWFKKMVNKNVYFEGLIAPPPLADGGL